MKISEWQIGVVPSRSLSKSGNLMCRMLYKAPWITLNRVLCHVTPFDKCTQLSSPRSLIPLFGYNGQMHQSQAAGTIKHNARKHYSSDILITLGNVTSLIVRFSSKASVEKVTQLFLCSDQNKGRKRKIWKKNVETRHKHSAHDEILEFEVSL